MTSANVWAVKAQYVGSKGFLEYLRAVRLRAQGCVRPESHVWITDLGRAPRRASTLYFHEWTHYMDADASYQVAWVVVSAETQREALRLALEGFKGETPLRKTARTCLEADIWLREAIVGEDTLLDMERHSLELAAQRQDELAEFIRTAEGQRIVEMLYRLQRIHEAERIPETIQEACEGLLSLALGRFLGADDPAAFQLPSFRDVHQEEAEGGEYFVEIDEDFDL